MDKQTDLQNKPSAIAAAIRYLADKDKQLELQSQQQADARIQWASKVQDAGNLVLAGTVISQMLNANFNLEIASVGLSIFVGAYLFAFMVMRGGGSR